MREEEPVCHDRLVGCLLDAVVDWGEQRVEVPQPHGLLQVRARWIEIFDRDAIFAKSVLKAAVAQESQSVRRAPDLLASLLRAKEPLISTLDGAKAVNEIERGEAAEAAVPVRVQQVCAHAAEFIHLHRIAGCPRNPLRQARDAMILLQ